MKEEMLKRIFEELLSEYQKSEEYVIYEHGSGVPGLTIEEELENLRQKVLDYRNKFYKTLEK